MNTRMFEEAQAQMEAAEAIAQEAYVLAHAIPLDVEAVAEKQSEYGVAFVAASAAIAQARYAEED